MRSYRGRFMIGVYSLLCEGETLIALCENEKEFAKYLNTNQNNADVILHNLFYGVTKYIKLNGKLRKVEFIEE